MIRGSKNRYTKFVIALIVLLSAPLSLSAARVESRGKVRLDVEIGDQEGADTVSRMVAFKNVRASEIEPLIKSRLSPQGILQVNDSLNMLIITDKKSKVEDLLQLMAQLDARGKKGFLHLETEFIPLKFISASKVKSLLEVGLSSEGQILVDTDHNSLLVNDVGSKIADMKELIKRLDRPIPQVLLESKIVEVRSDYLRKTGWDWAAPKESLAKGVLGGLKATEFMYGGWAVIDFRHALDFLSMLVNQAHAKIVSSPQIIALNNTQGSIEWSDYIRNNNTPTLRTGLKLNITPHIREGGEMTLEISSRMESLVGYSPEGLPLTSSSSCESTVSLRNGKTLVMGGMNSESLIERKKGIPILKEIPVIGILFRKKTTERVNSQLLIFLTPRLMGGEE